MTKPKGIFKKRKNKGNKYYRTYPVTPVQCDNSVETPNLDVNNETVSTPLVHNESVSTHVNNESVSTPPSASKRKLQKSEEKYCESSECANNVNIIINFNILNTVLCDTVSCNICGGKVTLYENKCQRNGLACNIAIKCVNCDSSKSFWTSERNEENSLYDINVRYFYGLRCIGKGFTAGKILSGMLNLPNPPTNVIRYTSVVGDSVKKVAESSMKAATADAVSENEGNTNISISFDGSWQRKGFQSKNSCATAISIDNGKVLDVEMMTKYCQGCAQAGKDESKLDKHKSHCKKNYEGTSGGMEVASAVNIFHRSKKERGVQYVNLLGDGDSKTYKNVTESKPYGDLIVNKLECVNHVQKRMGSRLRKMRQQLGSTKLSDGLTIKRRLSDKQIDQITQYYGNAIRENPDKLENMRYAVWAIFFHKVSSDAKPLHQFCSKKWCKYLKAQEEGEVQNFKHKNSIPKAVMLAIKPVFVDLSHPELLKKCLKGKTQNCNESFNNVVWTRLPKNVFVGMSTLELGVFYAVLTFNDGYSARLEVLENLGVKVGFNTMKSVKDLDKLRVAKAEIAASMMTKHARSKRRREALGEEDGEEDADYQPGGF